MKNIFSLLFLNFIPTSKDIGLLVLRLVFGFYMLLAHGWPKLMTFSQKSGSFPDPFGIGSAYSLGSAVAFEVVGSAFLIFGLLTRFSALAGIVVMGVAFFYVHKAVFIGDGDGELAFVYLTAYIVLFLSGGGRYAVDAKLGGKA